MTRPTPIVRRRATCRICGSPDLRPVIDLGEQCIASIFVADDVSPTLLKPYPLEVVRCASPEGCGLVQLRHTICPDVLYCDYGYRSGTNELMRENLRGIASSIEEMVELRTGDLVVDIGCNDGTLLESYETEGIDRLGFDPSHNVARLSREKGIDVVETYFSGEALRRARPGKRARVVTTIAMLYDLEDPCLFVDDVASLLAPDGLWVIELSYLPSMLEQRSFDTICHEHLEYYALRQLEWMLAPRGLAIHRILFNDVNGGSFRLYVRHAAWGPVPPAALEEIEQARARERSLGLDADEPYVRFRRASQTLARALRDLLLTIHQRGGRVYAYGASTKGNTILQYCGVDRTLVQKAADRNPEKWGRKTLGTNIPIISEEQAREENPDYFLVLPWHFLKGFIVREREFLRKGGKFIVPLPELRVIGIADVAAR